MRVLLLIAATMALAFAACGGDDDNGDDGPPTPTTPRPAATPTVPVDLEIGATATLSGEPFVAVRTLPSETYTTADLGQAGVAADENGNRIPMATAPPGEVEPWELISAAPDGWRVWSPKVVLDITAQAGAGATVVSVEPTDWPNACLGAPAQDESCAEIITPGYIIVVEGPGGQTTYHADRNGNFRPAPA
jgi:hypothetical protein